LHDFGSRGVSSRESAGIGGMAHLVNFKGSDTLAGVMFANHYYHHPMAAFSIPASEHSTITMWGRDREFLAYQNMVKQFCKPGKIVACVSDSYDLWNVLENIWGGDLRDEIKESGGTLVVRPDSGDPAEVVLKTLQILERKVGMAKNLKGYKVLPPYLRVIQGDGVNEDSIKEILNKVLSNGYSASNIAFGMGGALLQKLDRDTQKFAFKCSEATVDGKSVDVFKDPITDKGKRSKAGRLDLIREQGQFKTVLQGSTRLPSELVTVFEDGKIIKEYDLETVRKTAESGLR
jgi:nicotinamide phosphoribosyltransferase